MKRALTETEWSNKHHHIQCYDSWDEDRANVGVGEILAGPGYLDLQSHQGAIEGQFGAPADRHALAALCFDGQDFGFTRSHMDAVLDILKDETPRIAGVIAGLSSRGRCNWSEADRLMVEVLENRSRELNEIADRIEALIPPETKELTSSG